MTRANDDPRLFKMNTEKTDFFVARGRKSVPIASRVSREVFS